LVAAPYDAAWRKLSQGFRNHTHSARFALAFRKPEFPIEQPTKFNIVINLKTAMTLGLSVPDTPLAQADEVIE